MPVYQVKCKKCNKIFDKYAKIDNTGTIKCKCGGDVEVWFGGLKSFANHVWIPYLEENITHQPVMVESKKHLKELCDKNDCVAHRLA